MIGAIELLQTLCAANLEGLHRVAVRMPVVSGIAVLVQSHLNPLACLSEQRVGCCRRRILNNLGGCRQITECKWVSALHLGLARLLVVYERCWKFFDSHWYAGTVPSHKNTVCAPMTF